MDSLIQQPADRLSHLPTELVLKIGDLLPTGDLNWLLQTSSHFKYSLTSSLYRRVNQRDDYGVTPLHDSVLSGSPDVIRALVEHSANLELETGDKVTLLHLVCQFNFPHCVNILLEKGLDLSERDWYDLTPLHQAIESQSPEVVEMLLERGADIFAVDDHGFTPLHLAASAGNVAQARRLIQMGADIAQLDFYYSTPLHLAALLGHVDMVKFLLDAGADISREPFKTVLHRAVRGCHLHLVYLLIEAGADVAAEGLLESEPDRSLRHFCDPYFEWREDIVPIFPRALEPGWPVTAMFYAVNNKDEGLTRMLLHFGFMVSRDDYNLRVLLYQYSGIFFSFRPSYFVVDILREADPQILDSLPDPDDSTPVHWAAENGFADRLRMLQDNANPGEVIDGTIPDVHSKLPFIEAAKNDHSAVVQLFLDAGASPSTSDNTDRSALFWASTNGNGNVVRLLLDAGADVSAAELSAAAQHDRVDVAKQLIQAGADGLASNELTGLTPLYTALAAGNLSVLILNLSTVATRL